jgi:hypothetical protein
MCIVVHILFWGSETRSCITSGKGGQGEVEGMLLAPVQHSKDQLCWWRRIAEEKL